MKTMNKTNENSWFVSFEAGSLYADDVMREDSKTIILQLMVVGSWVFAELIDRSDYESCEK